MSRCRIVALISGSGSNLQALLDASRSGELPADIVAVISNKAGAGGLERAARAGVPAEAIDHRAFPSREAFDQALMVAIDRHRPDLVVLAGFMRILTPGFVQHFKGRLMNIHPSLLPRYPGLNTHQRAIDAGDREAGATVHFVTEELDGGPPIVQGRVPIVPGDDAAALAARVLMTEHRLYPLAARWFAEGRLKLEDGRCLLDDHPLPVGGADLETLIQ
ncbi:MAG: phosphoribosylglycinamide formyltransferase [Spongiibacteraceae bacterium]|jgi:phosphoribosylglycinamide formyltransferase-1|nr:phosphoribosylglycinamide formyltransferase [Spongiibacteraceae bacterium]